MPKLIQSQARGLLALLTSKDGGLGPAGMEDNLRITVDAEKYYSLNGRRQLSVGQTAAQMDAAPAGWIAAGGALSNQGWYAAVPADGSVVANVDMRVPEGELWRVIGVTIKETRITGTSSCVAGWAHGSFPSWSFVQIGQYSSSVAPPLTAVAGSNCDFLALPGSAPAFFFPNWDLGVLDANLNIYVVYEQLPL